MMIISIISVLFVEFASLSLELGLWLMFYQLQVSSNTPVNSSIHSDLSDHSASQLLSKGNNRLVDQVYYPSTKEFGGNWCKSQLFALSICALLFFLYVLLYVVKD